MKLFFARLLKVVVTGMIPSLFCSDYPTFLYHQAGQTFALAHGDLAYRFERQAAGSRKTQSGFILIEKINGADIRFGTAGDQGDDIVQRLVQVVGL